MSAETGAIIAKASTEANFKINLTWKKGASNRT
jgi:Trypsin-co-occurring domain 1